MNALGTFFKDFSWKSALVGFVIALAIGAFFAVSQRGTIGELLSELDVASANASKLESAYRQLAKSDTELRGQLTTANRLAQEQQQIIGGQQSKLGEQQRLIAEQQRSINDQQRTIDGFAQSVATGGNDLVKWATNIRELFDRYYAIAQVGTK